MGNDAVSRLRCGRYAWGPYLTKEEKFGMFSRFSFEACPVAPGSEHIEALQGIHDLNALQRYLPPPL